MLHLSVKGKDSKQLHHIKKWEMICDGLRHHFGFDLHGIL